MRIVHSPERVMPSIAVGAIIQWSGGMTSTQIPIMKLSVCLTLVAETFHRASPVFAHSGAIDSNECNAEKQLRHCL